MPPPQASLSGPEAAGFRVTQEEVASQAYARVIFYDIRKKPKISKTLQMLQFSTTSELSPSCDQ